MSPDFSITARDLPGFHIVALHGELDIVSAGTLADALVELAGSTLVVDLSDLTFMDSTGIGALVVARNRMLADGAGQLVLSRPGAIVLKSLEIVGLSAWIVEWSPDWDEVRSEHDSCPHCGSPEIATHFARSAAPETPQWQCRCSACRFTWSES